MTERITVVGAGGMGACHGRHLAELAGVEVVAVADPAEGPGRRLAAELGATWVADATQAIDDADAVVIASPDPHHFEHVSAALDRDLPVLCEKPLTVELADARTLVDREIGAGRRRIQVGFMRTFDLAHLQVHDALADLGPVNHLRLVHRNTNRHPRPLPRVLVESVIHDIHSARWLSGEEIVSVSTTTVERRRGLRFVLLACELGNGGVATVEFDDAAPGYEVMVEASAEGGNVTSAPPARATVRAGGTMGSAIGEDWFTPFLSTYRIEVQAWVASLATDSLSGPSAWDGYVAQAVAEAAVRSARSGVHEPVVLPPTPPLYGGDEA